MDKHVIANVQCLLLALRNALKQPCHWSVAWSMKLYWLLTTFQSDTASAHWRPSPVSDEHVHTCRFQSVSPGAGALVWFSCSQGWNCDILLLKQLLPDICQAVGDFCFPANHACTSALSCCYTRLWTSHQTCGWRYRSLISLNIHTVKYKPLKGSSCIKLPDIVAKKKEIINLKHEDNQCFKWAVTRAKNPKEKTAYRFQPPWESR